MDVAVDCVIFSVDQGEVYMILVNRSNPFFTSRWSLPGSTVREDEEVESAANRTLRNLTGIDGLYLDQVKVFSDPGRTPGKRIITVCFMALINKKAYEFEAEGEEKSDKTKFKHDAKWFNVKNIPALPLDHNEIAFEALTELKRKFRYEPLGFELLSEKFTLLELQQLYEAIYEVKLDKGNFRKKMLSVGHLVEMDEYQQHATHRRAKLFSFNSIYYQELLENGVYIDIVPKNALVYPQSHPSHNFQS